MFALFDLTPQETPSDSTRESEGVSCIRSGLTLSKTISGKPSGANVYASSARAADWIATEVRFHMN